MTNNSRKIINKYLLYLLSLFKRTYYKFKAWCPSCAKFIASIIPYDTRTKVLKIYEKQIKAHEIDQIVLSLVTNNAERGVIKSLITSFDEGFEWRRANFCLATQAEEPNGLVVHSQCKNTSKQIKPIPIWGVVPKETILTPYYSEVSVITCKFRNVEIEGDCLGIFQDGNFYIPMLSQASPQCFVTYTHKIIGSINEKYIFKINIKVNTHYIDKAIFFSCTNSYADNYFHFITEILPSLLKSVMIIDHDNDQPNRSWVILVPDTLPRAIADIVFSMAELYGLDVFIISAYDRLVIREIIFTTYSSNMCDIPELSRINPLHVVENDIVMMCDHFIPYLRRELDVSEEEQSGIVYLTRQGYIEKGCRGISNCNDIASTVRKYGGKVIQPESLVLAEQIQVVNNAEIVIFDAGAGVANALFCRKGTKVIVLANCYAHLSIFATIFQAMNLYPAFVLGNLSKLNADNRIHSDCYIIPDQFHSCVSYLLSGPNGHNSPITYYPRPYKTSVSFNSHREPPIN